MAMKRHHTRWTSAVLAPLAGTLGHAGVAHAQTDPVTSLVIRQGTGGEVPDHPELGEVADLGCPVVNHAGGFALRVITTHADVPVPHIWGRLLDYTATPTEILRTRADVGALKQAALEERIALANDGTLVYSADLMGRSPGFQDSLWIEDALVALQGEEIVSIGFPPPVTGFWRFSSRPAVTASGTPYFIAGIASGNGMSQVVHTDSRGLFSGAIPGPLLLYGQTIPNLGATLHYIGTAGPVYAVSADGAHLIARVRLDAAPLADDAIVLDGDGLLAGGAPVREGEELALSGATTGEVWRSFGAVGVASSGNWFFTAETSAAESRNSVLINQNGIARREGQGLGGSQSLVPTGPVLDAVMNEAGDIAYVWGVGTAGGEALYINDRKVLATGEPVDLTGDGALEPASKLVSFRTSEAVALSDRWPDGRVAIYFIAYVDSTGGEVLDPDVTALFRVVLRPRVACLTDFDGDGVVNSGDTSAFLAAWLLDVQAGTTTTDFDGSGVVNSADISAFISAWIFEAGTCS